jgi:long-chain fatty acid transport protein
LRPHPRFQLALDVNWQRWSTSKTMTVNFENEHDLLATPGANLYDVSIANDWHDTLSVRLGTELVPLAKRPLRVRGGLLYDQSPIDDRHFDLLAPDSDKIGLSAGLSYSFALGRQVLDVDLAFLHLFFKERDVGPGSVTYSDTKRPIPGSDKTIQNKPAPSFYYGVTRARVELIYLALSWRT